MVDHIYGRFNALNQSYRPHMFINEQRMYIDYWKNKKEEQPDTLTTKQQKCLQGFWQELLKGISYYKKLASEIYAENLEKQALFLDELLEAEDQLLCARLKQQAEA
ncbi:hypothetical protein [Pontibacter brevis]